MSGVGNSDIILRDRDQQIGLHLNGQTGLLDGLLRRQGQQDVFLPLSISAELVTEGQEVPRTPFGLDSIDTKSVSAFRCTAAPVYRLDGPQETYSVRTQAENWQVVWHYTFRRRHPRLEIGFEICPSAGASEESARATLRNVRLVATFHPSAPGSWLLEAPGNPIRPGVAANALHAPLQISPVGGVPGSTGVVAFHQPQQRQVLVIWPFSRTEIGSLRLQTHDETLQFTIDTELAGRLVPGEVLQYGAIEIDALDSTWEEVRDQFPLWYSPLGFHTPLDRADWIRAASIFEVQIGASVFWGDYHYAPYPTVRDLQADLERIKGLGYTMLQIMPRHPYPSYNVHDYTDITTSYGDEEDLRALVATCHAMGMRVILDILMHGVIDQEVIGETARRVRSGPYFERLAESPRLFPADAYPIAWSRHILDFEPYWSAGSPPRHRLADEHPEWFMRNSAQEIIGIYTKAFDIANGAWQKYFAEATEYLVKRLDIDGFRFDAPTYNELPNWSKATERRASYSPLGCLELFEQLRPRLKALKDDIILYTEPSGVAFRQAMDITYNYEEQWLIHAVLGSDVDERKLRTSVRNGRDMAAWFRDRNAVLPPGSLIAHHIDSHDTFWWPLPGSKWRREQYGLAATRALLAVFALSGGVYMTFVGGEGGLEDEVRKVHWLRDTFPDIGYGEAHYEAIAAEHEAIYTVVRQLGQQCSLLLVNLSDQPCQTSCVLDNAQLRLVEGAYQMYDAWNNQVLEGKKFQEIHLKQQPHTIHLPFDPFQVRLLVLRYVE